MSATVPLTPNGTPFPTLGLGTWKSEPGAVSKIVKAAIETGYRAIDCACDYGNEHEVGEGIKAGLQAADIPREKLFITSKLWNTYHRREHVRPACERTLADLGVDYLDLYLIHFPISLKYVPFEKRYPPEWIHDPDNEAHNTLIVDDVPVRETWEAMEALVDDGLVKHIGISNFPVALIQDLLSYARIKPSVLQVELHPYLQQTRLLEVCKRNNIVVTAFSPLGAASYVALNMDKGDDLLKDPVLQAIADRNGRSVAQVCIRWGIQRGSAIIPKTTREERLKENMDVFGWELSDNDMEEIAKLDRGRRYNDPGEFCVGMGMSIPIYD